MREFSEIWSPSDFILQYLCSARLHDQGGKLYWCFHSKYPKFGHWVLGFPSWMLGKGTPEESSLAIWTRDAFPKLVLHREFSLVDSFFSPSLRTICLRGTRKNRHLFRFVGLAPGHVPTVLPSRRLGYLWPNPQILNYWGLQLGAVESRQNNLGVSGPGRGNSGWSSCYAHVRT